MVERARYDAVIVGGGRAGVQTASSLRDEGFDGGILVVGDEAATPYDRPPLTKAFLSAQQSLDDITLHPERFYESQRIQLRSGTRAVGLDRQVGTLLLSDGQQIGYGRLVLATGARNRPLPFPGGGLRGVVSLRTAADAAALRAALASARRVVVIGGGFIGLEVAAVAARGYACEVTVIEALPQLMSRAALPQSAARARCNLESLGVRIMTETAIAAVHSTDGPSALGLSADSVQITDGVYTADGAFIPADLVVCGIGVLPNTDLARSAGLPVADGVLVDETLRTTDPRIWAVGDCAAYPNPSYPIPGGTGHDGLNSQGPNSKSLNPGGIATVRLESVQNATDQARHVARAIASGIAAPYRALPWFWSDQGDLRFQSAGLTAGHDRTVVLGDSASDSFSVLAFRGGHLLGGDSVNAASDHRALRRLLGTERSQWAAAVTPETCQAPGFALRDVLRGLAAARAVG